MRFANRRSAGAELAQLLKKRLPRPATIIALSRGGVIVAGEVALSLDLALEFLITQRITHPSRAHHTICALTETGDPVCDPEVRSRFDPDWLAQRVQEAKNEAHRRRQLYRAADSSMSSGHHIVLIDDGVATGLTADAAVREIRAHRQPKSIIVAAPIIPHTVADRLATQVDRVIALDTPAHFAGDIADYYRDFEEVGDDQALKALKQASRYAQATGQQHVEH